MQETFLLKILSKVVLFLVVEFIYSAIKMTFQKKEKPRRRRFANFQKNLHLGFGGTPTSEERNIPFPCLQLMQILLIYNIFAIFTYFLID